MLITIKHLKEACKGQVDVFAKEWPEGAKPTLANCQRAAELGLDLDWFAKTFLSPPALETYNKARAPAWESYNKATAPALETYNKATASAWETHNKARAPTLESYNKAIASAWESYNKAIAPALESYNKARAPAWETYNKARASALFYALKVERKITNVKCPN